MTTEQPRAGERDEEGTVTETQEVISWAWKMREHADIQLWIRGTPLHVYIPEQDRLEVAQSLARLSKAVHPDGMLDDGEQGYVKYERTPDGMVVPTFVDGAK